MQNNLVVVHKPSKILGPAGSRDLVQASVRASMKLLLADVLHTDRKMCINALNFIKLCIQRKNFALFLFTTQLTQSVFVFLKVDTKKNS